MKNIEWKAYLVYFVVALAVLLPLFAPGFILTLDLVFTPTLAMPQEVTSSYLFHAGLHALNMIIPSEIIQKLLLLGILVLGMVGMHRLIRNIAAKNSVDWGIYIASVFFAINPFTYSRFMAGQYAVLLGCALLPWVAQAMITFAKMPRARSALQLGGLIALIGVVSIHSLVAVGVLGLTGVVIAWRQASKRNNYIKFGVLAVGLFVALSGYWLVPLVMGEGKTAATISNFTTADSQAFATVGEHAGERIFNILQLQGFWAEAKNLYTSPQNAIVLWGAMAFGILGLVIIGAVHWWSKRRMLVMWFGVSALIGLLLAAGFGTWSTEIPLMQGLREPHKMVMLVVLFYGVFLAAGINVVLEKCRKKNDALYSFAAIILLLLPFLYMRVMFWGCNGQLVPRHYPASWSLAKNSLQKDEAGDVLFLPWHQYMTFNFAGRLIATPGPAFYGERIIASQDPEMEGAKGGVEDPQQKIIADLVKTRPDDFATQLAAQNIRFIILAKEFDFAKYNFLNEQNDLHIIAEYPEIIVYKNQLWEEK